MNRIEIQYPRRLVFGIKSLKQFSTDLQNSEFTRLFIITIPSISDQIFPISGILESNGISVKLYIYNKEEPTFTDFNEILTEARKFRSDCIAGIGGGSVMDVAKLTAALLLSNQVPESVVGTGLITERKTSLICIPTTSGTGSEVSPNAILLDEKENLKKGIISPLLVPDSVYLDPELTVSLPPAATAYTGIDALTHCIEAYANLNAHPLTDNLALEGIKLISSNLMKAIDNGKDMEARAGLALGSLYGGMCLGPVNTGAVHALAYPLGSIYKIPHGISNALLLPYVMEYNLHASLKRYVDIARMVGSYSENGDYETAMNGLQIIKHLISQCGLPDRLSAVGIKEDAIDILTESAFKIQRLLKNNVRELNKEDINDIYRKAL